MSQQADLWLRKIKILYQLLVLSLAINIGLILSISYKGVRKTKNLLQKKAAVTITRSSKLAVIQNCFALSYEELIAQLSSKKHIEDGFCYRDIALSCLIHFHDFAIDKVYLPESVEKRELILCKDGTHEMVKIPLLVGLDDQMFDSVLVFAKTNRYPLTIKGLLDRLQEANTLKVREEISRLIYIQEPFCALFASLRKIEPSIRKELVLQLILSGNREIFDEFCGALYTPNTPILEICQCFLKKYMVNGSQQAAMLLLKIDSDYCVHQLDQGEIMQFIALCKEPRFEVILVLKRILCSMRSSHVHEAVARKLYGFCDKEFKEPYDHKEALRVFLPTFYSKHFSVKIKST